MECLSASDHHVSMVMEIQKMLACAYELNLAFAALLDGQGIRCLQLRFNVPDGQKGLMRSFCFSILLCCQEDFQGIGWPKLDRLGKRLLIDESVSMDGVSEASKVTSCSKPGVMQLARHKSFSRAALDGVAYLSLVPPPAPLPCTDTVASSKLHDDAP